ncbi:cupredoxin domain-containing protein [Bacillus shivajii]|uniref:cupredoxin domain-containing protein n=1 Tax=Bacillus shivajii TaxID=1983719 RepID=UPI001CFA067F|nr:cupredoxin domain-containing protein [Bacillus shivajii]UCZ51402.1 cupredoxin domain-containing protein [Bacillus shivajii]
MNFLVVKKKSLMFIGTALMFAFGIFVFATFFTDTAVQEASSEADIYTINLVTGEYKTETEDGEVLESYRWDPGTVFIPKGEKVTLSILGVNGKEHPFIIEGTDVSGTVRKGEETTLNLQFKDAGVYRLICTAHASIEDEGPMIAYLVVQ